MEGAKKTRALTICPLGQGLRKLTFLVCLLNELISRNGRLEERPWCLTAPTVSMTNMGEAWRGGETVEVTELFINLTNMSEIHGTVSHFGFSSEGRGTPTSFFVSGTRALDHFQQLNCLLANLNAMYVY